MRILIIDDERAIRYSLKEILEMEEYQVETAENGAEGIEKAEKEKFDAIFCDIKMPGMDGIEVLETLLREALPAWREALAPGCAAAIAAQAPNIDSIDDSFPMAHIIPFLHLRNQPFLPPTA